MATNLKPGAALNGCIPPGATPLGLLGLALLFARRGSPWVLLPLVGCLVPDPVRNAYVDQDDDGHPVSGYVTGSDCDDRNPLVHPGAPELCDGLDNDCDGIIDGPSSRGAKLFRPDRDGDGFGNPSHTIAACSQPIGFLALEDDRGSDCDDDAAVAHPGAEDICGNGFDEDCDGKVDNGPNPTLWWPDLDGDGWGAGEPVISCAILEHHAQRDQDCIDVNPAAYPRAIETYYDGIDSNCDGQDDFDADRDGVPFPLDCHDGEPTIYPGAVDVWYDGLDSNCDGADDYDADGDGAERGIDCDDTDPTVGPTSVEIVNNATDEDCSGTPAVDNDLDGHWAESDCDDGNPHAWVSCDACVDLDGDGAWVGCDDALTQDCDDTDPSKHPGAPETVGDDIDHNCDQSDVDLGHGVFVSTLGEDAPGCGAPDSPCATLAHADGTSSELPLFVAGGDYAGGLTTARDLHGGFDASWNRTEVTTLHAIDSEPAIVLATGESQVITGLRLVWEHDADLVVGLYGTSNRLAVSDVAFDGGDHAAESCLAFGGPVNTLDARRVTVRNCSAAQSIGIDHAGAGTLFVEDCDIEVSGDAAYALRDEGGAVNIQRSRFHAVGGAVGIWLDNLLRRPIDVVLNENHIEVVGSAAMGMLIEGDGPVLQTSGTIQASGLGSRGIVVDQEGGAAEVSVVSTQIEVAGSTRAAIFLRNGTGHLDVHHATLHGDGAGVGVETSGSATFTGTLFRSLQRTAMAPAAYHACHVDTVCDGMCLTAEDLDLMPGGSGNQDGPALVDRLDGLWTPGVGSPLIDVSSDAEALAYADASGGARMVGAGVDIGAVEAR